MQFFKSLSVMGEGQSKNICTPCTHQHCIISYWTVLMYATTSWSVPIQLVWVVSLSTSRHKSHRWVLAIMLNGMHKDSQSKRSFTVFISLVKATSLQESIENESRSKLQSRIFFLRNRSPVEASRGATMLWKVHKNKQIYLLANIQSAGASWAVEKTIKSGCFETLFLLWNATTTLRHMVILRIN